MTGPLVHDYAPYGSARDVMRARDPEILLSGPAGTGKSRACLEKLLVVGLQTPRTRMLAVRKTQVSLTSTGMVTWREHVALEAIAAGAISYYGGSTVEPPAWRFANGSTLVIGGMDRATKIMSSEYDVIFAQEATELTLTDWEHLLTRLRNGRLTFQQLIADCNPSAPDHWLKRRCDSGKTRIIYCRHEDNPTLVDQSTGEYTERGEKYLGILDNLTGVRLKRLRHGQWVAAEGLVYEGYDESLHLIYHDTIPRTWDRYWSVDFGYNNPFVLQCWALSPDDKLVLYREIYMTGRIVEDHAKQILRIVRREDGTWIEPRPRAIICDHDAEDRATLERHLGLKTVAAKKDVSAGIDAVMARMKIGRNGHSTRIVFMRDSRIELDRSLDDAGKPTSTIAELSGYAWPEKTGPKEAPVKINDHGMDAMRYMCMHLDSKPRSSAPVVRTM